MHSLELFAMLGAAQGFLLLLLIIFRFRHMKNIPLTLLVLVFSLRLGTIPSWSVSSLLADPWLWPATTPLPFLFGPLLWWYARELSSDTPAVPRLLPLHFLPYLAETVAVAVTVSGMASAEYAQFVHSVFSGAPPLWLPIRNWLKVGINLLYIIFAARRAFGFPAVRLSSSHRLWLRSLVLVPSGTLAAFAFVAVNPAASAGLAEGTAVPFTILAAAMALLIYTFSFLVLIAPGGPDCSSVPLGNRPPRVISDEECRRLADAVHRHFDEGAFRDPELSLTALASRIGTPPNHLSFAVNRVYRMPFRKILNRRRIECFNDHIRAGALENRTILDLAFDAGFPSKSTFNRVFREETGMTPSAYARKMKVISSAPSTAASSSS